MTGDAVALLGLNRPASRNALSLGLQRALLAAVDEAVDNGAHVIVLCGRGPTFAAGADLSELASRSEWEAYKGSAQATFAAIERCPVPVVAAVEGHALGGGFELALACHLRVVSSEAKLGFPEASLGILPGAGGTQRLAAIAGRGTAMDLVLTARRIDGREAAALGIVQRSTDPGQACEVALALAGEIARNDAAAVRLARDAVLLSGAPGGFEFERAAQALLFTQASREERISALREKLAARAREG